jgi:hypothetical protein
MTPCDRLGPSVVRRCCDRKARLLPRLGGERSGRRRWIRRAHLFHGIDRSVVGKSVGQEGEKSCVLWFPESGEGSFWSGFGSNNICNLNPDPNCPLWDPLR